jgi:hypothetical protein
MKFKELREKYRSKFKPAEITKAVDIALSMGGNMTGAYKRIEAFKKGLANDPMVKQALRLANESVNEGTMAIGIKDRDPKERAKAQAQLKVMLKKIGNKKVGSKEGQDFDEVLDMHILSDDELADEFANPKNKNMKVKDLLKKHAKRLNVKFESVNEGLKKSGKGTVDVDYIGDSSLTKKLEKKFKVKIKQTGRTTADISGDYKNIIKLLKSDAYLMDEDEIEDTFSELGENVIKENVKAVMRKHKKHIDKWKRSNKPMPIQVEDELMQAAMKAGEIKTDDPEEFDNWLDSNL